LSQHRIQHRVRANRTGCSHFEDVLAVIERNDLQRIEFAIGKQADLVVVDRGQIRNDSAIDVEEAVFDPACEGEPVKDEAARSQVIVDRS
jgi:hypothetical protein